MITQPVFLSPQKKVRLFLRPCQLLGWLHIYKINIRKRNSIFSWYGFPDVNMATGADHKAANPTSASP